MRDHEKVQQYFDEMDNVMMEIMKIMANIWSLSNPVKFDQFRTFYTGTTKSIMFPNGIIFEGISEKPFTFRGSSAANDSTIPMMDNFL